MDNDTWHDIACDVVFHALDDYDVENGDAESPDSTPISAVASFAWSGCDSLPRYFGDLPWREVSDVVTDDAESAMAVAVFKTDDCIDTGSFPGHAGHYAVVLVDYTAGEFCDNNCDAYGSIEVYIFANESDATRYADERYESRCQNNVYDAVAQLEGVVDRAKFTYTPETRALALRLRDLARIVAPQEQA